MTDGTNPLEKLGGLRGLWHYLIARVNAREEIEKTGLALAKDRERNRTAAGYIDQLPPGAELVDYEDDGGRRIWIRKTWLPSDQPIPPLVVLISESAPNIVLHHGDPGLAGETTP